MQGSIDFAMYRDIIFKSPLGYAYHRMVLDESGHPVDYVFVEANPAFEQYTGLSVEHITGKRVTEAIPGIEKDPADWIGTYARTAMDGIVQEFEQFSSDLNKWYNVRVFSPKPQYFVTLFIEISKHIELEESLRQNSIRLEQYIEHAPDGIFITDEKGFYTQVNPAACALLGFERTELIGKHIMDITYPDDLKLTEKSFETVSTTGRLSVDIKLLHKNGNPVPVSLEAVRLPNSHYIGFCKDMTQLRKSQESRELYFSAIQSIDQPILITDDTGVIKEINTAFTKMYGFTREEVIGKNPNILNPGKSTYLNLGYTEKEYNTLFKTMWNQISDPSIATWDQTVVNRTKNGTLIWVRLYVNALFDQYGVIKNYIALPIDISKTRQKEQTSRIQLIQTIAGLAELRDNETGNHMRRVGIFAKNLAKLYGMPEKYCTDIEIFAPMHDIGKVGILDAILLAPRKLTPEEFEEMKRHTVLGYNIVKGNPELEMVAAITLNHHERYDGTGYPSGVAGEDIPLSARITSLVDVYDALRSERPYKSPWPHDKAREEILSKSGIFFDPFIVRLFDEHHEFFESVYNRLLDPPENQV